MIARISGIIAGTSGDHLLVKTAGVSYEVMIPRTVMKTIAAVRGVGDEIELVTYHYFQMDPSRGVPVLIGFMNDIEKEFFEQFISVSGIGPKAACKALIEPFSVTAGAIDRGDVAFLKKLPGIGDQRAKLIVAKLQGKVGKYGLIQDKAVAGIPEQDDIKNEALAVLMQLQYKKNEAEEMITKAFVRNLGVKTCEDLLNEVYRERKG
ncbi:MAG TPA: Holliday junction ATP-dependent DNA helicase RuvA [Candidatus Omnitrophota bacterium]|nr:Holliday junction ATP-dependent DNA helicase RuvA [Candidatus Omnitrophota bacterium]HPS20212.1 Holliday junction ATP-dependent DNA helicase RuvA [Candidatus Omnitrophota bacterium]